MNKKNQFISKKDALEKARFICSKEEKCIADILQKLFEWKISENDKEEIITTLLDEKFIDESRYTKAFVYDKIKFNKWGRIKIQFYLKQKKIPQNVIDSAFEMDNSSDYVEMIKNELFKKLKTIKAKSKTEARYKLIQFAQSRGYETDIVYSMIETIDF